MGKKRKTRVKVGGDPIVCIELRIDVRIASGSTCSCESPGTLAGEDRESLRLVRRDNRPCSKSTSSSESERREAALRDQIRRMQRKTDREARRLDAIYRQQKRQERGVS